MVVDFNDLKAKLVDESGNGIGAVKDPVPGEVIAAPMMLTKDARIQRVDVRSFKQENAAWFDHFKCSSGKRF